MFLFLGYGDLTSKCPKGQHERALRTKPLVIYNLSWLIDELSNKYILLMIMSDNNKIWLNKQIVVVGLKLQRTMKMWLGVYILKYNAIQIDA